MRKRILAPMALVVLLSACGAADDAPQDTAPATTVTTADGALGAFLVDGDGRTLYLFTVDEPGVSNCDGDCLTAWPPLLSVGDPAAGGSADPALTGTIVRDDGSLQVTYAGWPLYFFAADAAPGDINGQGVNDVWFVVAPDGTMIPNDTAAPEPTTESGPADTGGGYTY